MPRSTVVISRSAQAAPAQTAFEDGLAEQLQEGGCAVVLIPHLYYLPAGNTVIDRVAEAGGSIMLATWMKVRAARWTLAALGGPTESVSVVDMATFESPQRCAAAILQGAGNGTPPTEAGRLEDASGAAVAERWYPVIDYSRCRGCKQCVDFCLFGVYAVEGDGRVVATQPDNCKNGCPACSRVCPAQAIMFPHCTEDEAIAGGPGAIGGAEKAKPHPHRAGRPSRVDSAKRARDELDKLMDDLDAFDDS